MTPEIVIAALVIGAGVVIFGLMKWPVGLRMTPEDAEELVANYKFSSSLAKLENDVLVSEFVTFIDSLGETFDEAYRADRTSELAKALWWILDENVPFLLALLPGHEPEFARSLREEYVPQLRDIKNALAEQRFDEAHAHANREFNSRDMDPFTFP